MKNIYRRWLYHKENEGRIFEAGELIPEGWYDSPDFKNHMGSEPVVYVSQMNKTQLLSKAEELEIFVEDPEMVTKRELREMIEKATK